MIEEEIKEHTSFSELRTWLECPHLHKLVYIDKITVEEEEDDSHYLDYGTILHETIEKWLASNVMDIDSCEKNLRSVWSEKGYDSQEYIQRLARSAEEARWVYKHKNIEEHISYARNCLSSLPEWMNEQFGDWKLVSAEERFYEPTKHVLGHSSINGVFKFKGFIDAIILSRKADKRGKVREKYWILDWKTAPPGGWSIKKQQDIKAWGQLAFYKKFWAIRESKSIKDIGCAFVLLKKTKETDKALTRINVSVGPKAIEKIDKKLGSFVESQKSKLVLKNRTSCRFCDYRGTKHCNTHRFSF